MQRMGLIHLYTGNGKGKTTAAVGLAARMSGCGGSVVFAQFLKGADSGERMALSQLPGVTVTPVPQSVRFVFQMDAQERAVFASHTCEAFAQACALALDRDLLILDEALGAVEMGMLPLDRVLAFLRGKPEALEVVLTGRSAPKELTEMADYVMRVDSEKHPYDRGIAARRGIEY